MRNSEERRRVARRATTKNNIPAARTFPLVETRPKPSLKLPTAFSSMSTKARRDIAYDLSQDAQRVEKRELDGIMADLARHRRQETDPETRHLLDIVIEEAAWKGCALKDVFFAVGELISSSHTFSEREKGMKIIDHAISNKQDISPVLEPLAVLLSDYNYVIASAASGLLMKYASSGPSCALQVAKSLGTKSKKTELGMRLMQTCDSIVNLSTTQQPWNQRGATKKTPAQAHIRDGRVLADTMPEIIAPKADAPEEDRGFDMRKTDPQSSRRARKSETVKKCFTPVAPRRKDAGRYDVRTATDPAIFASKADGELVAKVKDLTSTDIAARMGAASYLKANIDTTEKARDILAILPPDYKSVPAAEVRTHCIELIRRKF